MKKLFRKWWFQVLFFGTILGAGMIIIDNRIDFWKGKKDKGEFRGVVSGEKDEMYFTKAEYPVTEFDFGEVAEGDTVRHTFTVKNTGDEPLFIFKAVGSCECIHVGFTHDPIPPGSEQKVEVVFLTKGRNGAQLRTASINTNTDPPEMILTIKGKVR